MKLTPALTPAVSKLVCRKMFSFFFIFCVAFFLLSVTTCLDALALFFVNFRGNKLTKVLWVLRLSKAQHPRRPNQPRALTTQDIQAQVTTWRSGSGSGSGSVSDRGSHTGRAQRSSIVRGHPTLRIQYGCTVTIRTQTSLLELGCSRKR